LDPTGRDSLFSYYKSLEYKLLPVVARAAAIRAWVATGVCLILNVFSAIEAETHSSDPIPPDWTLACVGYSALEWANAGQAIWANAMSGRSY
ncbi:MAG TPA: hypothetical protein VHD85_21210, partial [Terracidiphilus sp.]|nr:hypothetical protein [Terracidiphilus sp.]